MTTTEQITMFNELSENQAKAWNNEMEEKITIDGEVGLTNGESDDLEDLKEAYSTSSEEVRKEVREKTKLSGRPC